MDWVANGLASTLLPPYLHPRSRVYSSAPADELCVRQVTSFHQLYVFFGGLFAAGFCESVSTRQDHIVREDLRCLVLGRVAVGVPATFCFCGVFVVLIVYFNFQVFSNSLDLRLSRISSYIVSSGCCHAPPLARYRTFNLGLTVLLFGCLSDSLLFVYLSNGLLCIFV
ncbi:hypothetical protein E2C01_089295 [Portunus trituberculatus]|uniref:Uncharacterized protein n=1 Tax=Portunus trituberculatus TaxID=210409 RepID=A0A5B7JD57_PORTR|nr:hypothetical protein [Portunus trituberculatus]